MANNKKRGRSKQNKHARRVHQNAENKSSRSTSSVSTVSSRTPSDSVTKQKKKTSSGAPVKSRWMAVVIIILAILMVLSVLLPSLSSIFGARTTANSSAASSDATEASTESMDTVDAKYSAEIADLQTRLDNATSDNERLAPLLNLGNTYLTWASDAGPYATDETGQQHVQELYGLAQSAYEEYLALHESNDVRTRVALCQFYAGDVDGAINALESFVATDAGNNYGPAWAYLGMMYQQNGDTEAATHAYTEATRADADDSYGAKSYATQQLANLQSAESGNQADTATSQESLENVLNNAATSGN